MPIVPKYEQRVRATALPDVRVSTNAPIEAFGGGAEARATNAALGDAFENQRKIFAEEVKKADDSILLDAQKKAVEERNKALYHPETGAMNRQGRDAIGVVNDYGKQYVDSLDGIENTLNERQKERFKSVRLTQESELNSALQRHTFIETEKYNEEVLDSSLSISAEDAALNYSFPGKIGDELVKQEKIVNKMAMDHGRSAAWVELKQKDAAGKTHLNVINKMLQTPGSYKLAKSYYEETKDTVPLAYSERMESVIKHATVLGESQESATKIMAQAGQNERLALSAARKTIDDPEIQEATVREIKNRYSENEQIKRDMDERKLDSAINSIYATRQRPSAAIYTALSTSGKNAVDSYYDKLARGEQQERNSEDYYNLKIMASYPDTRDKFLKTNLREYVASIHPSDLHELIQEQDGMRSGKGPSKEIDDFRTKNDIRNKYLGAMGIKPNSKKPRDIEKMQSFDTQLAAMQRSYQAENNNKKMPNKEFEESANTLATKVVVDSGKWYWPNQEKRIFEVSPGDNAVFRFQDIPTKDIDQLREAMKNPRWLNREPTETEILREYEKSKRKKASVR